MWKWSVFFLGGDPRTSKCQNPRGDDCILGRGRTQIILPRKLTYPIQTPGEDRVFEPPNISWSLAFIGVPFTPILTRYLKDLGCLGPRDIPLKMMGLEDVCRFWVKWSLFSGDNPQSIHLPGVLAPPPKKDPPTPVFQVNIWSFSGRATFERPAGSDHH